MLKGEFLPPCTVHKACNFFFFMNSWLKRQKRDTEWGGQEARLSASDNDCSPLASSRIISKQTLKSMISLLVFPSDGEQWLNTVPNPRSSHHRGRKTQLKISKRHIGTCVGMCMCAVILQGHTCNTVSGSSEVSPGLKCHPLSKTWGSDPTWSESLRWGIIRLCQPLWKITSCKHYPVKPSVDSILQTLERRKEKKQKQTRTTGHMMQDDYTPSQFSYN